MQSVVGVYVSGERLPVKVSDSWRLRIQLPAPKRAPHKSCDIKNAGITVALQFLVSGGRNARRQTFFHFFIVITFVFKSSDNIVTSPVYAFLLRNPPKLFIKKYITSAKAPEKVNPIQVCLLKGLVLRNELFRWASGPWDSLRPCLRILRNYDTFLIIKKRKKGKSGN